MNLDSLGARLREARKETGKNQDEIALLCGVSREMWGKYERGVAIPGGEVLAKIALAGMDVVFVLTGQRSQPVAAPALSKEEEALLDNYKHADDEGRRAAQQVLTALSKQRKKAA